MKFFNVIILIISNGLLVFSQQGTLKTYLFMGHPRSDDRTGEYLLKTVEKADYSKFDLILLGGDLTWNTSELRGTLEYCDRVFDFDSEKTHWALGNHDLDNITYLEEFRKKPRFYSFTQNNITFLILDTEITSPDFSGDQLALIKNVTDTIQQSDYLILVHHRIVWLAGNNGLAHLRDSVAASSKNITSEHFNTEVYPLLQEAKNSGVSVLCLAGDRTNINIEYSPEDSINYLASGLAGKHPDENNYVIVLTHYLKTGKLNWEFVPLSEIDTVEKRPDPDPDPTPVNSFSEQLSIYPNPADGQIYIVLNDENRKINTIEIFNISGELVTAVSNKIELLEIPINISGIPAGIYFLKISCDNGNILKKISKVK